MWPCRPNWCHTSLCCCWLLSYSCLCLQGWVCYLSMVGFVLFFFNSFLLFFIGPFSVWRAWGRWRRRCARKRTALPSFVTMGQGSVKLASLGMMLQEQFSLPLWVVPGTRWWTALVIPYKACRRRCCPVPSPPPQSHLFLCLGLAQPWVTCVTQHFQAKWVQQCTHLSQSRSLALWEESS